MTPVSRIMSLLPALLVGCASFSEVDEARTELEIQRGIASLAQANDGDSLAAAALLTTFRKPRVALSLIARASAASPHRADLAWLHARICALVDDCNPEPIEAAFRATDSGNAAGWMGQLSRAHSLKHDSGIDRYLEAIGESQRFDVYWTTLSGRLTSAVVDRTSIAAPEAIVAVTGALGGVAIPPYAALSNACKGERLERDDIRSTCRSVAAVLQRSDTYITEMIGVAIAKRAWPADSPEVQAAAEARRIYRYRTAIAADVDETGNWTVRAAEEYLRLLAENRTEQEVFRAKLVRAGRSPDPPGDWIAEPQD